MNKAAVCLWICLGTLTPVATPASQAEPLAATTSQECIQPNPDGCTLELDGRVGIAVLDDPDGAHLWIVTIPTLNILKVQLRETAAPYRLYIYGPDQTLQGLADREDTEPKEISVQRAVAGSYQIWVDSPTSTVADSPYTLLASSEVDDVPRTNQVGTAAVTGPVASTVTPTPAAGPVLTANPNPVPTGGQRGATTIAWDTGDGTAGRVYVYQSGGDCGINNIYGGRGGCAAPASEALVASGPRGSIQLDWIENAYRYEFRLYRGRGTPGSVGSERLASIGVTGVASRPTP